jgi:AAA+ ATPase superfamily predicted ATPase
LRLYSEDEFETIENPYAPIADGGPVTDKRMFYGRDEFINNRITAILNADSKQIIIYGQKRSGKSSVLHHLKQGLEATDKTFCISFSLGEIIRDLNEYTFYYKIIYGINRALRLRKAKGENVPVFTCPTEEEFKTKYPSNPANGFIELIEDFQMACLEFNEWKSKKLVVMIDEFTYLYTAIRNGSTSDTIMKQWKAITQNENAKFSVVLVGQDVVPSFKKEDYAKNAFGVIEDIRLTYLDIEDAKKLIEEPILNKNGESRFIGRAIDTIIDYTSRNPYYIQIFCARLVDYINSKKILRVTEADIKDVAETFIEGSQVLAPEKFDNLIRAGEEHDFIEFDDEPVIKILRQIAIGSKNIGICSRDNISLNDKKLEDMILNHLVDREVLECKQGDNYKIQVKLFQEWLLKH